MDNIPEYIYLIREREFVRFNESVYKIGRTTQTPNNRMSAYPKGSEVILTKKVINSTSLETVIINNFKKNFKLMTEYGNEYFLGDVDLMVTQIDKIINE